VIYRLQIRPDAFRDIESAAEWYEQQESGLGSDFALAVLEAIDSLLVNPLHHRLRDRRRNVRWLLTKRFPYKVVYKINKEQVEVFAVLHAARHDRQWKRRL
jgi:plasmid stabilization system protein ParE